MNEMSTEELIKILKQKADYLKLMLLGSKKKLKLNDNDKYILYKRDQRIKSFEFIEKQAYMNSKEWNLMKKIWLHESGYRCQMFPFIILGQHGNWNKGYYGNFAVHHTTLNSYKNLGKEVLNKDVVVLSKFAHEIIFHYLCSFGSRKVRDQKILAFPNFLQISMNYWCKLTTTIKILCIIVFLLTLFLCV